MPPPPLSWLAYQCHHYCGLFATAARLPTAATVAPLSVWPRACSVCNDVAWGVRAIDRSIHGFSRQVSLRVIFPLQTPSFSVMSITPSSPILQPARDSFLELGNSFRLSMLASRFPIPFIVCRLWTTPCTLPKTGIGVALEKNIDGGTIVFDRDTRTRIFELFALRKWSLILSRFADPVYRFPHREIRIRRG